MGRTDKRESAAAAKLRQLGLMRGAPSSPKPQKLSFRVYFPRAPYQGAEYTAAKGKDGLYNFVGLVLGHHGTTIQRLQRGSGAKIEIHSKDGNLNGDHPPLDDITLHALVQADSRERLEKGVALVTEVLQPTNTTHKPFAVASGQSVILQPVAVPGWEQEEGVHASAAASTDAGARAAQEAEAEAEAEAAPQTPNAWLDRLRTRQQGGAGSAESTPAKPHGAGGGQSVLVGWPSNVSDCAAASLPAGQDASVSSGSCCSLGGVEEEPPREWSLWDSGSCSGLYEQLQSVVQETLQQPAQAAVAAGWASEAGSLGHSTALSSSNQASGPGTHLHFSCLQVGDLQQQAPSGLAAQLTNPAGGWPDAGIASPFKSSVAEAGVQAGHKWPSWLGCGL